MVELVHSAQNFMNAEDAIIARKRKRSEIIEGNPSRHSEQGPHPKKGRTEERKDRDNKKPGLLAQNQQYTPLNVPLEQVLMQIKDDPSLKWLEKSGRRKWRENPTSAIGISIVAFIETMCMIRMSFFDLKQQIENLIRQGKLKSFLGRDHKD